MTVNNDLEARHVYLNCLVLSFKQIANYDKIIEKSHKYHLLIYDRKLLLFLVTVQTILDLQTTVQVQLSISDSRGSKHYVLQSVNL